MSVAGATGVRKKAAPEPRVRHVMDIRDAAAYLGINGDTLYRYAKDAVLPSFKLGNRYRFRKEHLDDWMDRQAGVQPETGKGKRG